MHELDELKRVMQEKQRVFEELERSIQGYTVGFWTLAAIEENHSNTLTASQEGPWT